MRVIIVFALFISFLLVAEHLFASPNKIYFRKYSTTSIRPFAKIHGKVTGLKRGDTVLVTQFKYGMSLKEAVQYKEYCIAKDAKFDFQIEDQEDVNHIVISIDIPNIKWNFLVGLTIFRGDEFEFQINRDHFQFAGKDSAYYQLLNELIKNRKDWPDSAYDQPEKQLSLFIKSLDVQINMIESFRSKIGGRKANVLIADEIINSEFLKSSFLFLFAPMGNYHGHSREFYETAFQNYLHNEKTYLANLKKNEDKGFLSRSTNYTSYLVHRYFQKIGYAGGYYQARALQLFNNQKIAQYFQEHMHGIEKDKVLLWATTRAWRTGDTNLTNLVEFSSKHILDSNIAAYLRLIKAQVVPGAKLMEFNWVDMQGRNIKNSDVNGKIVLIDSWFTGCGNCREIHPIIDSINRLLRVYDFQVLSVSTDLSKDTWLKSIKGGKYTSGDNLNVYTNGRGMEDPFFTNYQIDSAPYLILFDKDGKLLQSPIDPRNDQGASIISIVKEAYNKRAVAK